MNAYQPLIDAHLEKQIDKYSEAFLRYARNRAYFFLKHGERFDRRLYSDISSIIRIYCNFVHFGLIESNPEKFKKITKMQDDMLQAGKQLYKNFP